MAINPSDLDQLLLPGVTPDLGPDNRPDNGVYQNLVDHCMKKLYEKFKNSDYRERKIEEIKQSALAYEQIPDPKKKNDPWTDAVQLSMPFTTITIDNLEPRLVSGLVGTKPVVRFKMEGVTEQDEMTKAIEYWFNGELEEKVKIEARTMDLVHTILKEGTYYCIPSYKRNERIEKDFVFTPQGGIAVDPTGQALTQDSLRTIGESGALEAIPFTDILCADDVGTPEEWEKCDKIRLIRPTYSELMRWKEDGVIGYLADKIGPWLVTTKSKGELTEEQQTPVQQVSKASITGKETIECGEFYITYPISRDEEERDETKQTNFDEDQILVTIHLATSTLIRLAYQRDLNFSNTSSIKRVRMFAEQGKSYGTGVYGKIKAIQDGCSDFFSSMINIAYLVMLPWFFYSDKAGMRGKFEIKPGEGIPVDDVSGILIPNFRINPSQYFSFIEMFIQLWERLGSIANPQIGRPEDTGKTATEIMMVVQEGNIKFDYQSKVMKEEFLGILELIYDLYYQHMPYDKTIIYQDVEVPLPRKMMKRGYKFLLSGSTASANWMIERKEAEDMVLISRANPELNVMKALEEMLKTRGKVNIKEWINPAIQVMVKALMMHPEIPQVVDDYLAQKSDLIEKVTGKEERPGQMSPHESGAAANKLMQERGMNLKGPEGPAPQNVGVI